MPVKARRVKAVDRVGAGAYAPPMTESLSGLDDPRGAAHAWARFRRILYAIGALGVAVALAVVGFLWWLRGPLPPLFVIVTVAGIWLTIMTAGLLMGLMFLSSGTGHDSQVEDRVSKSVLDELGESDPD